MNSENVISLQAVSADLLPFRRVKMTATGVDYAGAGDTAIGFILPGDLNRNYPTVQLLGSYAEAVLGNGTDVARGDELEAAADGKLVKKTTGAAVAVAVTGATEAGDRFDCVYYERAGAGAAPVFTSTNGVMAAAADLAAVKAEGELIGDDVRALRAALVTAGILV